MLGRPVHAGLALLAAALVLTSACARRTVAKVPAAPRIGTSETGIASWYGVPYNGRRSASGEIYDMEKLTAAHRTFPFGTWLEVTDLDNGKKVEVRINDRGPFVSHRIIDLSLAAARDIEMVGPGTARVRLKVIAPPIVPPEPVSIPTAATMPVAKPKSAAPKIIERYAVQAGVFSSDDRAENFAAPLRGKFEEIRVELSGKVWRVLIGRQMSNDDANQLAEKVKTMAGEGLVVVDP